MVGLPCQKPAWGRSIERLTRSGDGIDWVVPRIFSKAYGLAGLRTGYVICSSPDVRRLIEAARSPFRRECGSASRRDGRARTVLPDHATIVA
ncbi:aminotransferase class I/II-fold pyridoxal phosphate-dependent enzyme [Aureimonas mangrovi]|uniref:aminotransferase class I/II-fold pyridoxal phosphate-dependent enzyme n=1 Tax=Aureimonas mangrovi TaxID=2758041 RepID=UPI0031B59DE6